MKPEFPRVGALVCDCWFVHQRIVSIAPDRDTVTLADGLTCSYSHCCDPADHEWPHPQNDDPEWPTGDRHGRCLHSVLWS